MFSLVVGALITGEAGIKSGGVVKRAEHPFFYWLLVILMSAVCLVVFSEASKQ
jgi:hypothetical protein